MGARYYQPGTGRFTQQDPLPCSVRQGQRYACAGNSPVNFIDPAGTSHYPNHHCYRVYDRAWGITGYRRSVMWVACMSACAATAVYGGVTMAGLKAIGYIVGFGVGLFWLSYSCQVVADRFCRTPVIEWYWRSWTRCKWLY